jgi:N-acetylglucosamine-6-phosphate deacetylase
VLSIAQTEGDPEGQLIVKGRAIEDGAPLQVHIKRGVVASLTRPTSCALEAPWIGPGWMDLQVNGFAGHDLNRRDVDASTVIAMVRSLWSTGVTALCPTVCTASEEQMLTSLRAIALACQADQLVAASVIGIHVEGPHIAREDGPRGAHPLEQVRPPDIAEYRRWQLAADHRIRIITLSPEYDESMAYIQAVLADGVVASIGHTAATGDQIRAAVDAGARWSTHLGNGAHALIPRHPNYIWDQLAEDRLGAGFIFDGHHLPPSVMKSVLRAKGVQRSTLVTDALAVAGLPPGLYDSAIGGRIELSSAGRVTLVGSPYLAGSAASLGTCISNAIRHADVTFREAVAMVTTNPSRLLNLPIERGHESLRVGAEANLTLVRQTAVPDEIEVAATVVAGRLVYTPPQE